MKIPRPLAFIGSVFLSASAYLSSQAQDRLLQHQYEGRLGTARIGLTILRQGNTIRGGHYFYQKYLRDIPITGSVQDSKITLVESCGGSFDLHFVGNGSEGQRSLDFENSIGMDGSWRSIDGKNSYPVSLRGTLLRQSDDNGPRYREITTESDADFEKRVQSFLGAVLHDDRTAATRLISYPLNVNGPKNQHRRLRTPAEVAAVWDDVFTPILIAKFRTVLPHDMFVREGFAMVGNGEAWFDAKGLATLNVPDAPRQTPKP